jgi:outer membrane receptor protein involved in Fe transport
MMQFPPVLSTCRKSLSGGVRVPMLILMLMLLPLMAGAQTTLTGRVVDGEGTPLSLANVQLRTDADSSIARATVSDVRGNFVIEAAGPGSYRVHVSRIGYRSASSDVLALAEGGRLQVTPLVLQAEAVALTEISVAVKKPLYQQRADRLVINIESSPALAGASALQVLERSPGVVVDRMSNSITLIGKAGVRVMINGRLSYIPADALMQYLSGVGADNIERIELITSPPASLDAEGNAGYINIVMRRSPGQGVNGSMTLSAGYGGGELGNASTHLDYQGSRIGVHANYSFLWNSQKQFGSSYRRVVGTAGLTEMPGVTWRDPVRRNHDARVAIDYRVSDRTTVGAVAATFDNRWSMDALNRVTIIVDGGPVTGTDSDNQEVNHWRHAMGNLNLQHKLGSAGTLGLDLDYLGYGNDNPTVYSNTSTHFESRRVTTDPMASGKTTPLRMVVAKADYTREQGGWEFGAGLKGAFSRFTNETSLQGPFDREWAAEAGFGSTSRLREDVLAAYGTAAFTPSDATTLKMGLRYELTDSNLGSNDQQNIVDCRFGSLFPSVGVTYKLGDDYQLGASLDRRVTRPTFNDMAPFLYFIDPNTFFSGNAGLQPAIINTLKLDGTFRSVLASLQYAREDSSIARFQSRFIPAHNIHVMSPTNFSATRTASALLAFPVHLTQWWSSQNNAMLSWQEVDGSRNGSLITVSTTSHRFNSTQNITVPRDFGLEASGFYQSARLFGTDGFGALWAVNLGLQKTLRGNAKITLAVNDLFDSQDWKWTTGSVGDPLYIESLWTFSHRTASLTYSTRFGGGKAVGKRSSASEDERRRVQ